MKLEWEVIEEKNDCITGSSRAYTQRLKVWGGWIIERIAPVNNIVTIIYNRFIEDPDHLWGKPEPKVEEGITTCPACGVPAFISPKEGKEVYAGGYCLACKIRYCSECSETLQTQDMTEKCKCGFVNEWKVEK